MWLIRKNLAYVELNKNTINYHPTIEMHLQEQRLLKGLDKVNELIGKQSL